MTRILARREAFRPIVREAIAQAPNECVAVAVARPLGGDFEVLRSVGLGGKGSPFSPPDEALFRLRKEVRLRRGELVMGFHSHSGKSPPHLGDYVIITNILHRLKAPHADIVGGIDLPEEYALTGVEMTAFLGARIPPGHPSGRVQAGKPYPEKLEGVPRKERRKLEADYMAHLEDHIVFMRYGKARIKRLEVEYTG